MVSPGWGGEAAAGSNGNQRFQLGTFEIDMKAGELRRNGTRVRLQEQPFQILSMLIERPGEVDNVLNTGTVPYILYVTFPRVPVGVSPRTDEPDPGTCPGI